MDEKRKEEEACELTPEEIDDMIFEEQIASGEHNEKVPEYYFSNPDPYAKIEPRSDDAQKRDIKFDENGNIVVKNLSVFWLPEVTIVDEVGGAELSAPGTSNRALWKSSRATRASPPGFPWTPPQKSFCAFCARQKRKKPLPLPKTQSRKRNGQKRFLRKEPE